MIAIDWISLALIGALGISGFFNGFAKEISSAIAWVVSIVGAWYFGPLLFPYLEAYLSNVQVKSCLLYTSPSPRDGLLSRMPSSA